jgi:hypothetical protein
VDERSRALLEDLRGGIDGLLQGADERAKVAELAGAVERRLKAELELTDDDDRLSENLHEAAVKLEADHPALATALRRAVDVLAAIGL